MTKSSSQQLRIIGGEWRSRRLHFPALDGLRPTLDRVRETVFNWLQHDIHNAVVLDAFAGSGAMGLEALSRGAQQAVFLEKNPKAAQQLSENLTLLKATQGQVWVGDALLWLAQNPRPFDVVFLDPPFGQQLLQPALNALMHLPAGALVYLEHEATLQLTLPSHWLERRHKKTKEFCFRLFEVQQTR